MGNGVAHAPLTLYILANAGRSDHFFVKERELGGLEGPGALALIKVAVGLLSIKARWLLLSFGWNCFVAILGTLLPIVWPRFLSQGLNTWPTIIIFIWFVIFAMELIAAAASATWFALAKAGRKYQ